MTGLTRFDFYPRDWHLDTRDLSAAAKGIYIDLLAAMYARGNPLPDNERELCRVCGCATVRSLRPLLIELIDKGKLHRRDGTIFNNRAIEEIEAANRRMANGSKGGSARRTTETPAVQLEYGSNTTGTQAVTATDSTLYQGSNLKPPSPPPPSLLRKAPDGAPPDGELNLPRIIFGACLQYLIEDGGIEEAAARRMLGKWRNEYPDEAVQAAITTAQRNGATNPRSYVTAILNGKANRTRSQVHRGEAAI